MAVIDYEPGDGHHYVVEVTNLADVPRGLDGTCAFCHGDPTNERPVAGSHIALYYERNPAASTCPMCDGRPT